MSARFGEFGLLAEIGHGGMADVFLAVRLDQLEFGVDKLLVVKRLRENLAADTEFITMLIDEARLAARLNHPNIVQTNEIGCVDGQYFISMEYLDGQPLNRVLNRLHAAGQPTQPLLFTVIREVLTGLDYAHALKDFSGDPVNLVHRDVTPQNVFITYDGGVKIVDFGIAKAAGRSTETREGVIKGKVAYMSPQQALASADLDGRSDLFAVGVLLFEAACGERLWKGQNELTILRALANGDIPSSPKARDPAVPDALDAICRRALAYQPDDRFDSAEEMAIPIETFARSNGLFLSRKQIASLVGDLFADKRAEVRKVVDRRLMGLRASSTGSVPQVSMTSPKSTTPLSGVSNASMSNVSIPPATFTPSLIASTNSDMPPPSAKSPGRGSSKKGSNHNDQPSIRVKTAPKRRSDARLDGLLFGGLIAVLAVLLGVMVLIALNLRHSVAGPDQPPVDIPMPAPSASNEEKVKVIVRATPEHAKFRIDEGPILDNPYIIDVARSPASHTIRAQAPGYRDRIRTVRFDRNINVDLALEPVGP